MPVTFNAQSTTEDVLGDRNLTGKRILVTGVSAGIGVETARTLAAHGATVIGATRDLGKARAAIDKAQADAGTRGHVELTALDLGSLASVRACADRLLAQGEPLDLVIANAGVMACPKGVTTDGFETQFGTNHLGHFVLVNRVAPLLRAGARVVMLASAGHRFSDVDLDDPNFEHTPYEEFVAYGRSKTANIQFAVAFDRRHKARGVRAIAVHPGGIQTELARHLSHERITSLLEEFTRAQAPGAPPLTFKSVPQGAATSVWAGVVADADAVGGRYCEDCHVAEIYDGDHALSISGGVRPYALDPVKADALWVKSEDMVGERF